MTQPPVPAHVNAIEVSSSRSALRKELLARRQSIDSSQREQWDALLARHLLAWCERAAPASLAVYWPIRGEPDLRACYAQIAATGIILALPWVRGKQQPLEFLRWHPGDAMQADAYGIPLPLQREQRLQPEAMLIPCVGFNVRSYRLGYGGGYYDRTLAQAPSATALGLAYQCLQAAFQEDAYDRPMRLILTEQGPG